MDGGDGGGDGDDASDDDGVLLDPQSSKTRTSNACTQLDWPRWPTIT